jgi:Transposase DDE domain
MRVNKLFHKWLADVMPGMHQARLSSVCAVASGALKGGKLNVTSLGRSICSGAKAKHSIKRADRLFSNPHLQSEQVEFYTRLTHKILGNNDRPVILVDWSDIDARREFFLLRAAVAVGGRSITLYEEVHARSTRETRKTHREFLVTLKQILPADSVPILVTDAGFRVPWFKQVRALGWDFVGRVRNRELIQLTPETEWIGAKSLYSRATAIPQLHMQAALTRSNPLQCSLVLFKDKPKGRKCRTKMGKRARSRTSLVNAARAREPWLLVTSLPDSDTSGRDVVRTYATRMQIEESFRDLKSHRYGLDLYHNRTYKLARMKILVLIGAIAATFAWLLGRTARSIHLHRQFQANTTSAVAVLSHVFVGIQIFRNSQFNIPWQLFLRTTEQLETILFRSQGNEN